jgi:hypothetical protein
MSAETAEKQGGIFAEEEANRKRQRREDSVSTQPYQHN